MYKTFGRCTRLRLSKVYRKTLSLYSRGAAASDKILRRRGTSVLSSQGFTVTSYIDVRLFEYRLPFL